MSRPLVRFQPRLRRSLGRTDLNIRLVTSSASGCTEGGFDSQLVTNGGKVAELADAQLRAQVFYKGWKLAN